MCPGRLESLAGVAELQHSLVLVVVRPPPARDEAGAVAHGGHVVEGGEAGQRHEAQHVEEAAVAGLRGPPHGVAVDGRQRHPLDDHCPRSKVREVFKN